MIVVSSTLRNAAEHHKRQARHLDTMDSDQEHARAEMHRGIADALLSHAASLDGGSYAEPVDFIEIENAIRSGDLTLNQARERLGMPAVDRWA